MKTQKITKLAMLLAAMITGMLVGTSAYGSLYMTPAGSTDADGAVDATASFTLGNGTVTITLTDLEKNLTSAGEELSGIDFVASGVTGTASLASSSGYTTTISKGGAYTTGVYTSPLAHWGANNSVNLNDIGIVGHMPYDLIIGPDSAGGFTGVGKYSNANSSVINFNPNVLGSATFTVDVTGVTVNSTLSDVVFYFGTSNPYTETVNGVVVPAVPESSTIIAGALLLLPLGASTLRILRKNCAA